MLQVNLLSMDVSQPYDKKGKNLIVSGKESDVSTFASLVEKHIEKASKSSKKTDKLNLDDLNSGNVSSGSGQEIKEKQIQENKFSLSNEVPEDKAFDEKHERSETPPVDEVFVEAATNTTETDEAQQAESQKLLNFLVASDEVLVESGIKDKRPTGKGDILAKNTASTVTMSTEQSKSGGSVGSHSTVIDDNLTVTQKVQKGAEQLNSDDLKGISQRDLIQQQSISDKEVTQASKGEGKRNDNAPKMAFDKAIEIAGGAQNNSSLKSLIKEAQLANGQKRTEVNANAKNITEESAVAEEPDVNTQTETQLKGTKVNAVATEIKSDKSGSTSSQNTLINSTISALKSTKNQNDDSSINNQLEVDQQSNKKESVESKVTEEQNAINNGLLKAVDKNITTEMSHNVNSGGNSIINDMGSQAMDDSPYSQQIEQLVSKTVKDNQHIQKTLVTTDTIAIYKKEFAAEMKDKVMVMINQKLQQVDIQLDPPELGNVHVRVNLQHEQASVSFIVQNQQAKEALEQHMGKLRDMLGDSGVDVGDSNVDQQNQSSDGDNQGGQFGQDNQNSTNDDVEVSTLNAEMVKGSAVGVDFYA